MDIGVLEFETTPNPNAIKCLLDQEVSPDRLSFFSSRDAEEHPLARSLFAIEGVTHVMLLRDWITVGKAPESTWGQLKPKIKRALRVGV